MFSFSVMMPRPMGSETAFRVNHECVVEVGGRMEPDRQAQREYAQHFGKLDLKDLKRRYREAKRAAERREREREHEHEREREDEHEHEHEDERGRLACVDLALACGPAPKRSLVQSTLSGWVASPPPCGT